MGVILKCQHQDHENPVDPFYNRASPATMDLFVKQRTNPKPMPNLELLKALDHVKAGAYKTGPQLEAAHEIAQSAEGEPLHDWLHALVHRIEGDDWNADYWYRRAGQHRHDGSVEEEWEILRAAFESD